MIGRGDYGKGCSAWFGREELTVQEDMSSIWAELLALRVKEKDHIGNVYGVMHSLVPQLGKRDGEGGVHKRDWSKPTEDVHSLSTHLISVTNLKPCVTYIY